MPSDEVGSGDCQSSGGHDATFSLSLTAALAGSLLYPSICRAGDVLVFGDSVRINAGQSIRARLSGPIVPPGADDEPTVEGGRLGVFDTAVGGAGEAVFDLPAGGWKTLGKPCRVRGFRFAGGACERMRVVSDVRRRDGRRGADLRGRGVRHLRAGGDLLGDAATTCAFDEDCPGGETCVLGPDPSPRYVDNLDGTVTDRRTCLVWEKKRGTYDDSPIDCSTTTCGDPHEVDNHFSLVRIGFSGARAVLLCEGRAVISFEEIPRKRSRRDHAGDSRPRGFVGVGSAPVTMEHILSKLPPDGAARVHPDWKRNEEADWARREALLRQYEGQWIGVSEAGS